MTNHPKIRTCGTVVLARFLKHVGDILQVPASKTFAWTDSLIVLHWISGHPRKYNTFIGNWISEITETLPPEHWKDVASEHNPADCVSRDLMPSELINHQLWWNGPPWLLLVSSEWPSSLTLEPQDLEMCLAVSIEVTKTSLPPERYSSYLSSGSPHG